MTRHHPPEYALLTRAASGVPAADVNIRNWDRAAWNRTLDAARWHRLTPALWRQVAGMQNVPDDVRGALEQAYVANAARNLFLGATITQVLGALADADVPAMPLKGAALIETVYDDPGLREMLDVDLLVPADRLEAANAALATIGYRDAPGSGDRTAMRVEHHHDPALIDDRGLTAIELHHHIAMAHERPHFDISDVWTRARPSTRPPAHQLPSPADLLLHVCLHFTRNRLGGSWRWSGTGGALAQLRDIREIVEHASVDWDVLAASARGYQLDTRVFLALFAAREIGIAVPHELLTALRPSGFTPALGRRLISLRVLRAGEQMPVRSVRRMVLPDRGALRSGWAGGATGAVPLARAYARRAAARLPLLAGGIRRPWTAVQDRRLNGQIAALERATELDPATQMHHNATQGSRIS